MILRKNSWRIAIIITYSSLCFLPLTILTVPASAKVLAEGADVNGYYWQKVEKKDGSIEYLCRSTSSRKFQKFANCENAGAQRP